MNRRLLLITSGLNLNILAVEIVRRSKNICVQWVRGQAGILDNERTDQLVERVVYFIASIVYNKFPLSFVTRIVTLQLLDPRTELRKHTFY